MRAPAKWMTALAGLLYFAGAIAADEPSAAVTEPTKIEDWEAFDRILNNRGLTLQWIDYDAAPRGAVKVEFENRTLFLQGEQRSIDSSARVTLYGSIVRLSSDEYIFRGTILIDGTPDEGRYCTQTKDWRFAITQNRKYWRLREFEWCDGLTDYIDIYF